MLRQSPSKSVISGCNPNSAIVATGQLPFPTLLQLPPMFILH